MERLGESLEGRTVTVEVPEELPRVSVDPEFIGIVIWQLFSNALRYTPPGSPLTLRASAGETEVIVSLEDCGPGISEPEQRKVFDKFYRGKDQRERIPGTGMGLTIAREIVRAHHGRIWVESEPGKGTRFSFSVPRALRESVTVTNARILVVDDEPQIRRVMRTTLVARGYMVSTARNGEEALEKVREERFDLVLLDINMPGIGGMEACRIIRSQSDIPIVILSIRNAEKEKVEALDAGADDYVTKPFSMPELLARIRAALRRAPLLSSGTPDVLNLGQTVINFVARRVTVDGTEVRLTPKEFDLLRYFAGNPDVAIPHTKLLQAVWGPDYGEEVEYLRVFINQLRKKIEPDPSHPAYLLTEPWVGYRFSLPKKT